MPASTYISPRQFAVLIITSFVALGLFEFPRELVVDAGPDSVYAFFLDVALAFVALWLHFQLAVRYPRSTLGDVSRRLIGILSWPFMLFNLALDGTLAVITITNFAFVMQTFFLNRTPAYVIITSAMLVITYVTSGGTTTVARTMEALFLPTAFLSSMLAAIMFPHMQSTYAILPSTHIWLSPMMSGAYHSFYIFLGMGAVNMLFPFVHPHQQAQARRLTYWALLGAAGWLFLGYVVVLGNSGPGLMAHLFWPPVKVMRTISLNSFLINKLGLIVVLVWGVFVFGFVAVREWAFTHVIMATLQWKGKTAYRRLSYGVGAAILVASFAVPNVVAVEAIIQLWLLPIGAAFLFLAPIVLLAMAKLSDLLAARRRRVSSPSPT